MLKNQDLQNKKKEAMTLVYTCYSSLLFGDEKVEKK